MPAEDPVDFMARSGKIRAMKRDRFHPARLYVAVLIIACLRVAGGGASAYQSAAAGTPPKALSDREFWNLSKDSSEQDGFFRSDNLLSNETSFQHVIPDLVRTVKPGRVYLGVGPEQNFTYISALRPAMAIILDIRHGNLDVQLMYKALFELSTDRADFVSRLFSRKRPERLTATSTAAEIFDAFLTAEGDKALYEENLRAIEDRLTKKHGFPLSEGDREGIRWAFSNFYRFGPAHQLRIEPVGRRSAGHRRIHGRRRPRQRRHIRGLDDRRRRTGAAPQFPGE